MGNTLFGKPVPKDLPPRQDIDKIRYYNDSYTRTHTLIDFTEKIKKNSLFE
jgi:hypothetical protein